MLTSWQSHLAEVLGAGQRTLTDVQLGKALLGELLADKACLLILDDVWQTKHAAAFDALGQRCKMLLTTRDRGLITALGAVEYQLGVLSNEQALALLALWAGQHEETLPTEAHEVVRECGNLPLALAMIGAMVRGKPDRWANVLHKLRNADLEKIRHQFPDYPYSDLLKAIKVSVEDLEPDVQRRYLDFAVFPEDTPIPEAALQTFWEPEGLDKHETQDVVYLLVERSLARHNDKGHLSLHDLQYDYVRKQADDLPTLHNRLLNAYTKKCPSGWHTGPNDGYFFEYLAYHLKESEQKDELYTLLTASPDWMEAKFIACTGDVGYVADLELAIADFANPLEPTQLLMLIRLHTARQAVNQRVSRYSDTDLKTLVWLEREAEALSHARLRPDPKSKFYGLLTIHSNLQQKGQPNFALVNEALEVSQAIEDYVEDYEEWSEVLSELAAALAQAGCEVEANTLFIEAEEVAWVIEEDWRREWALSKLAAALAQAGRFIEAEEVIQAIEDKREQAWVLSKLAAALAQAGHETAASKVFTEAEEAIEAIEDYEDWARLLSELAVALIQAKQFIKAEAIAWTIEDDWRQVSVLSKLAAALAQTGHEVEANTVFTEAEEVARTMKSDFIAFQSWSLKDLAAALAQVGRKAQASVLFTEAGEVSAMGSNWNLAGALRTLAAALAETKHEAEAMAVFTKAEKVAQAIENDWSQVRALKDLAIALTKAKYEVEANQVFIKAEEAARTFKDGCQQAKALSELAAALAQAEREVEANALFIEAKKVLQVVESDEEWAQAQRTLAAELAKVGRFSEAREVIQAIEDKEEGRWALEDLARALAKAGHFIEAEKMAQAFENDEDQAYVLWVLAAELAKAGHYTKAEKMAWLIEDYYRLRAMALSVLAVKLAKVGQFTEAERVARSIEDESHRVQALGELAAALAEAGRKAEANLIFAEAGKVAGESTWQRESALSSLATALARVGRFAEALSTLGLRDLDQFLSDLAKWIPAFEKVQSGLLVTVLREAVCIAGWVHPSWRETSEIFYTKTSS
jgi:Flp pilus assembly protein TadD